jgi:hypothetical protein
MAVHTLRTSHQGSMPQVDLIRAILDGTEGDVMPGQRYQDPKIQIRTDVKRPFNFIRPYVPVFTATGVERKKHSIPLGFVNEITMREAKARKRRSWPQSMRASSSFNRR